MNTQQIKNSILETFNTEERIINELKKKESRFLDYKLTENPTFFFQAIPLINNPPERLLNEDEIRKAFRDQKRRRPNYDLRKNHKFSPTMHGFKAERNEKYRYEHLFEIQHNGYLESILMMRPYTPREDVEEKIIEVNTATASFFNSILTLTDDLINELKFDLPYLLSCKLFVAKKVKEISRYGEIREFEYSTMEFSQVTRNIGFPVLEIAHDRWIREFYNAFGKYPPPDLLIDKDE